MTEVTIRMKAIVVTDEAAENRLPGTALAHEPRQWVVNVALRLARPTDHFAEKRNVTEPEPVRPLKLRLQRERPARRLWQARVIGRGTRCRSNERGD